jgi:hypothetical protein
MFTLELVIVRLTWGWKKFTQSCLCESPSISGARFALHLWKPKISSPSICVILIVQAKPKAYLKTISTSYFKSPDWVPLGKSSQGLVEVHKGDKLCQVMDKF